jgi:transcriptional regulator GlxA family with amidase domain
LSERRFGMLFQRQVGMRPKHYTRLLRFRAVVDHAAAQSAVNWSQVAADGGYFDQAHLTHEFRQFAGVTPTAFMAARGPYSNHLPLD